MEIDLKLMVSPKLQQIFPNDPHSDFTLTIHSKSYKLEKAHLRIESEYFRKLFDENKEQQAFEIDLKCDPTSFEKVLKCFYGFSYKITVKEIYQVYEIVYVLEMENLINLIEEFLISNLNDTIFFLLYKISHKYQKSQLIEKCEQFLIQNQFGILKQEDIFDISNFKYPIHIVDLDVSVFKYLFKFHNKGKTQFIGYLQQFGLIQKYCQNKFANKEEQLLNIKQITEELIEKQALTAQEYKQIYHQDLFISQNKLPPNQAIQSNQSSVMSIYSIPQPENVSNINLLKSENILYQKEVEELKNQNQGLVKELNLIKQDMQDYLGQVKQFKDLEKEVQKKLVSISQEHEKRDKESTERINTLQDQVVKLKQQLEDKSFEFSQLQLHSKDTTQPFKSNTDINFYHPYNQSQPVIYQNNTSALQFQQTFPSLPQQQQQMLQQQQQPPFVPTNNTFYQNTMIQQQQQQLQQQQQIQQQQNIKTNNVSNLNTNNINNLNSVNTNNNNNNYNSISNNQVLDNTNTKQQDDNSNNLFNQTSESFFIVDNQPTNVLESKVVKLDFQTDQQKQQYQNQSLQQYLQSQSQQQQNQNEQVGVVSSQQKSQTAFQVQQNKFNDGKESQKVKQSDMQAYYDEQIKTCIDENKIQTSQCNSFVPKIKFDYPPETISEKDYPFICSLFDINMFQQLRLVLLYRGSRDGYTNQQFMAKCAKQTKTLVLIRSWEYEKSFGGYTSVAWQTSGDYLKDDKAFIFQVNEKKKFLPKNTDFSIYLNSEYILCYGNDIMIGNNCNKEENSLTKFPEDYICPFELQDEEKQCYLTGAPNFQVDDIEIYKVNIDQNMDV